MKIDGVHSAAIACVLYGVSNFLLDRYGRNVSAIVSSTSYSGGVFLLCLVARGGLRVKGMQLAHWPSEVTTVLICVMVVIYFCADYLYLNSFSQKADIFSITIMATLVPVIAAAIKFAADREVPSGRHVLAWLAASLAIYLLASIPKNPNEHF